MKPYLFYSVTLHGAFAIALVFLTTLLTRPRMSYYAVDLFNSAPAAVAVQQAPPAGLAPPVKKPPPAPPKIVPEAKPAPKEAIRVPSKEKKKVPPKAQPKSAEKIKSSAAFQAAMRELENHSGPVTNPGTAQPGAGVVADAGPAFPYPWYLQALVEKLDKQWHPPQEFQSDTVCQVQFVIHRDGQVSDSHVEKRSGDSVFDQLALRAILYANPLPPLPSGFPEDTLRVHMKFVGKQ